MIEVEQLSKRFGPLVAVDNLSFTVSPGEVLGFLGPNGAGKSTTMKMLTGYLAPDSGKSVIYGHDVHRDPIAAKQRMGYLPEGAPAYADMSVASFLAFCAAIRQLGGSTQSAVDRVVDQLNLDAVIDQPIETLSKGFKRRVGIAQAILHDPSVLILDEPTDGLDPVQKNEVRKLIRNLSAEKIVIVSTHILEEVNAVCSRAMIIANGRLVADDTPDKLEAQSAFHGAVSVKVNSEMDVQKALSQLASVERVEYDAAMQSYTLFPRSGQQPYAEVQQLASDKGWQIEEIYVQRGRLEDVFERLVTEQAA